MRVEDATQFINSVTKWAQEQSDISGLLLVGSYAHEKARADSDIDLVFFTFEGLRWLERTEWMSAFGKLGKLEFEDWDGIKTQRAFFINSFEVEFSFASPNWASIYPIDRGTLRVMSDGARVLYDPQGYLQILVQAVQKSEVEQRY